VFRLREEHYLHLEDIMEVNWEDRWRKHVPVYSDWYDLGTTNDTKAVVPKNEGLFQALYNNPLKLLGTGKPSQVS